MLLTNTTTTGGDTGAHIAMPKFLEGLVSHGHLTGWDPGWYDGFPSTPSTSPFPISSLPSVAG